MEITIYHVDAFANKIFSGNPAAVCILPTWLPEKTLQLIAAENYLPVTAFLVRENNIFHIRWFTPEYEIDLCGHGSLASAYVIFTYLEKNATQVELHHTSGPLYLKRNGELFTLNFPAKQVEAVEPVESIIMGLGGIQPQEFYQYKSERCLAVYRSEAEIRNIKIDLNLLKQFDYRGFIVTARSKEADFVSRTFYPHKMSYEDAVTGSSHCLLIPYWTKRLNKNQLHAYQISPRGGELFCENQAERVLISGHATLYMQGKIIVPDSILQ